MCVYAIWMYDIQLQAKNEFLDSVKTLERLGFHLFASYGTADFYHEHGVKVQTYMYLSVAEVKHILI